MRTIDNAEDLIDSRDVIARIEELEGELEALTADVSDAEEALRELATPTAEADLSAAREALASWEEEFGDELDDLKALAAEAEPYAADWQYGETLIRASYFRQYAEDLADDIGAVAKDAPWPQRHIDWDASAEELKHDYTAVSFGGVTYWVR